MNPPAEDIPADIAELIRLGTIAHVDLEAARCIVRFGDPDDAAPAESPPIRWLCGRAGRTRIWSPPSVGEQVVLLSPDGQLGNAIAITGIVQDAFPPAGATEAEVIAFADGARVGYDPIAHALTAILPGGATAEIDAPGGITLRGPVAIEGDVTIQGAVDVTQDVTADGISLTGHLHGGVTSGGAKTLPPE